MIDPLPPDMYVTLTVKRYAAGAYSATTGKFVTGAESSFSIQGSFQPWQPKATVPQDGGRRNKASARVYTPTQLREPDETAGTRGDIVTAPADYGGGDYEVVEVDPWVMGSLNHYKAYLQKLVADGA